MNKRKILVYVRYIYPTVAALIALALLFVPCYKFVTADGENDAVSIARLTSNSWAWATECLWGTGIEQSVGNVYFSQTVIALVAVFWCLFFIGAAMAVYVTVSAFMSFKRTAVGEKNRIILISFFFNRIVTTVIQALVLLLLVYPKILPLVYRSTLNIQVETRLLFVDPLLIEIIVLIAGAVISVISRKRERDLNMDVFAKPKFSVESTEHVDEKNAQPKSEYEKMAQKAKEEQAERLLDLLNKKK